jgi:hypothetical protein
VASVGRARRAAAAFALTFAAATAACAGGGDVPPVPQEFKTLEQREAGCLACHNGGRAPTLDPRVAQTPPEHPPLAVARALRRMSATQRAALRDQALASEPE